MATASAAHAETLLMPDRDFLMGAPEVVWGISTLANGTAFSLDYGDGSLATVGTVGDRSYIAFNHIYAISGTFTVTLTVGAEAATAKVQVFNSALLSAADLRGLKINKAIEDGLRYLWVSQSNRTTFDTNPETSWDGSYPRVGTSFAVLAFENHNYKLPNNANTPTGIYPKYAVQRGMNYIVANLAQQTLNTQTASGNPCVGIPLEPINCTGLYNPDPNAGYGTSIAVLAVLGSSALNRPIPVGLAGGTGVYVGGKTLGEVAQRLMNTVAWGQNDGGAGCVGRGGWYYTLTNNACTTSDGSTVGWNVLALLDAGASGVAVAPFVSSEFAFDLASSGNTDGSFDYNADNNPASSSLPNLARAGIYLQSLFYRGVVLGDPRVTAATKAINDRWTGNVAGDYTSTCSLGQNKGCSYGMYNAFKGLKLYGIASLTAASDWYGEYQDFLVATQTSPTATTGGSWASMQFSCCGSAGVMINSAIAELILAPVALVAPDPTLFSTVGLSPASAINPVGTDHTVTAFAQSTTGTPVPGVTITFRVLVGSQNAGKTGTGTTAIDGKTSFTYHDDNGAGVDTIQAFIGTSLSSNVVTKTWVNPTIVCDVNGDGKVTNADLLLIRAKNGQAASGPNDPFDPNKDGRIDVADVRYCQLRLTPQ
ncbi:MAG: dockerin type I domain-containing protein [Caldimonas sp.]